MILGTFDRSTRRARAIDILNALALPLDAPAEVVDRAVYDAYPWGERKYHPYKVWLSAVKQWKADRVKLQRWGSV